MDKGRIYASAAIVCYWIVNLVDGLIEVYTDPSGPSGTPAYAQRTDYREPDMVPDDEPAPVPIRGTATVRLSTQQIMAFRGCETDKRSNHGK